MTIPTSPDWLWDGSGEPTSARAVLYLETVDLAAVQRWHDLAAAALLPLVEPPGAPAFEREVIAFGGAGRLPPGDWAAAMVPDLDQVHTVWGYGDDPAHGTVEHADLRVYREYGVELPYLRLDLLAGGPTTLVAEALVGVVRQFGADADPVYGEIMANRPPQSPHTALDRLLRRPADDSMAEGRRYLRGYEWVTLCPPEPAAVLGGAAALRATGAFAEVTELGAGGLLLRATTDPADYTEEAARRVFEAVRAVLPPGEPRRLEFETLTHVVMENGPAR